jgi:SAM-dependent methyltransferase
VSRTLTIATSPALIESASAVARDLQAAIGLDEPWTSLAAYLDGQSRLQHLRNVEASLGAPLAGRRILELGSGMGMLVTVGRKLGLDIVGLEPGANSYRSLREATAALLAANDIAHDAIGQEPGEDIPFPDESFDVVVSFQVLEHVKDPARTLAEAMRVLRDGGQLYFDMPNYHSLVEGHYGLAWCPLFAHARGLAKAYVRMAGRNPAFIDELNFVTPALLRRWIAPLASRFTIAAEPAESGASQLGEGLHVVTQTPSLPTGERFRGASAKVRSAIRRPRVMKALNGLGVTEHSVVTAVK